jgi:adhesin transport system membrane fusion protein
LLIEARLSPRDIAFIRPGLPATVKITAYDPSIYGTLDAVVDRISPDTLQDEVHRDQVYYRVYLHTDSSTLRTKDGKEHAIMPGMVATVDIRTGSKTILDYLLKPVNKAKEALRER